MPGQPHSATPRQGHGTSKNREDALLGDERRWESLCAASNEGLFDWDLIGGESTVSGRWLEIYGLPPGSAPTPDAWRRTVHHDDLATVDQDFADHLAGKTPLSESDYRIRDGNGVEKWLHGRALALRDSAGQPIRVFGTVADITDRRRAETALHENEERLRLAITAANQGLYDLNVQTGEASVSPEYASMLGYDSATFHETNAAWIERLHPDDRERVAATYRAYVAGELPAYQVEFRQRTASGDWKWILSLGKIVETDGQGRPVRMLGTHTDITDRKRAEVALAQANVVVENSPAIVFRWKAAPGWPVDFVSRNVRQFGYSADELMSGVTPFAVLVHPEDLFRVSREVQEYGTAGTDRFRQEYRIVTRDGRVRWVDDRTVVERDADGQPVFYQGIIIDTTDRKEAEEALTHSHRLMRYIIEHNRSAIAVHDRDLRYVYVSQRYLDDYHVKEKDVIGRHHYEVFPDLPQKWRDVHQKALAGEVSSAEDDPYERDDGSVDWTRWECRPWQEADGSIGGIIVYTEVITDRKRAEEALRLSEERLRTIIETEPECVKVLDGDGQLQEMNAAGLAMLEALSVEEVRQYGLSNFVLPEYRDAFRALVRRVVQGGTGMLEFEVVGMKGTRRWLETHAGPMRDAGGGVSGLLGVTRDITERKRAEQALRASLEEKTALIQEIHHRVKNNLQVISSLLSLQAGQEKNRAVAEALRDTQNRVRSMALLHEMLYRSEGLARVDFGAYLDRLCAHLFRTVGGNPSRVTVERRGGFVELGLEQAVPCGLIVSELVSNALKHAFPNDRAGRIIVDVNRSDAHQLTLAVVDDGVGLPSPFDDASTSTLGLQLVRILVTQLKGTLTEDARQGAAFRVVFPDNPTTPL